jgi:hypothetical protein
VAKVTSETASMSRGGSTGRQASAAPLSWRVLRHLPGPRLVWACAWALVPWLNLAIVAAPQRRVWTQTGVPVAEILNRTAVSFAILLSLWGAARIAAEIQELPRGLSKVIDHGSDVSRLFRGADSVVVPLLLTAVVSVVLPLDEALSADPVAALTQAITWAIIGIPLSTAFWLYVVLQRGLYRLGHGRLTLMGYRGDRSLGLRPVGRLAFTGYWMLVGTITPLLVTSFSDLPGLVVGVGVLVAGTGLFFVSLRGLHRQMHKVRQHELDTALGLYEQAYQQVQERPTLEALEQNVGLLNAAESLEKRAERIQDWPFDEAMLARVVTIASGVAGVIIARVLLAPVGL